MATASFDNDFTSSQTASVALSKTPQMYLDILALLGQASESVQSGARPQQTTAILQRAMTLVSSLSVAILVPDYKSSHDESTLKAFSKFNLQEQDVEGDIYPFDIKRTLSEDGSSQSTTPSSPALPASPALSGSSGTKSANLSAHRGVPSTPKHSLLPPGFASMLTPPPSDNKVSRQQSNDRHSSNSLGPEESNVPGLPEMPAGFQSSLVPSISEADFRARATFHRNQGRGVTEAYDLTLTLHGATVIDGMTIQFKITDAYFNPESYNYSESLQTPSGMTGYRYDNRNGSTYIRFDEPTGPRTQFVRHAHPPYIINGANSQRSPPQASNVGSPFVGHSPSQHQSHQHGHTHSTSSLFIASPTPNKGLGFVNMLPTPESTYGRSPAHGGAGKFSVHDLWN